MHNNKNKQYSGDDLENDFLDIVRELSVTGGDNPQQRYKSLKEIIFIIFNIALSSFYFGYSMVYLPAIDFNLVISIYDIEVNKQFAQGLLVSSIAIGGGLGAVSSSWLIQRLSRRNCLLFVNLMAAITGICLYIPNFYIFTIVRLMQGFFVGILSSLAPLIMKQLSPNQISGMLTSCHQIFITFGATFGFAYSSFLSFALGDSTGERKWPIVFGFSLLALALQSWLLIFKYNFQTPKYLLQNNRQQQARHLIERIYKPEHVDSVLKELKMNINKAAEPTQIQMTEKYAENNVKNQVASISPGLQTPRSAMIAAFHLAILQQMSGCNAIVAYGGAIVAERQPSLKQAMPIIINLLQFGGAIIACFLLMKIGRKFLLEMGALTTSVASIIVAFGFINNSLTWIFLGLVLFMACFGLTLGPVVWIYLPQVAQPRILSIATALNWGACTLVMFLFPIVKEMLPGKNPAAIFIFFSVWSMASYFFNKKYVIQTRNKGQKQIFDQFSQMKPIF